jgi:soluble lytic murein transglycosylase-like protein
VHKIDEQYVAWAQECGDIYSLKPTLLMSLILAESGGKADARSQAGAVGLCQFMPDTARDMGMIVDDNRDDRLDPKKSIESAAKYLDWIRQTKAVRMYAQDRQHETALILAAYNAGIGTIGRYRGIPPYPETLQYVGKIISTMKLLDSQIAQATNLSGNSG